MMTFRTKFLKTSPPDYSSKELTAGEYRQKEEEYKQTHNFHDNPDKLDPVGTLPDKVDPKKLLNKKNRKKLIGAFTKVVNKLANYDKKKNIRTDASKKYKKGATRKFAAKKKNGEAKTNKKIQNKASGLRKATHTHLYSFIERLRLSFRYRMWPHATVA